MTCVIGLCGKKQSGKNTFAKIAKEYALVVGEVALADALKDFCSAYLGIAPKLCYGTDKDKNTIVGEWGSVFAEHIYKEFKKEWIAPLTVREVLQVVGTEIFRRNFTEDFWINILMRKIESMKKERPYDFILITDVRFPNEVLALKARQNKVVRLYRDTGCTDTIPHASELAMDSIDPKLFDYIVPAEKNITPETLRPVVQEILLKEIRR
jgi:hypothetical protein